MYCRWRSSCQERRFGIPLTRLTLQGPGFPTSHVMIYFVFSKHNLQYDEGGNHMAEAEEAGEM